MGGGGLTDGKSVLVVDDDRSMRLLCRVNLELEGHRVNEAASLDQAREEIERETPDVILLDLSVGGEDGRDLLDEISALELPARVVLLSGAADVGPDLRARVHGVLGKPFDLGRLSAVVAGTVLR
jgi:two-component system, NtrC family, response regulator PilR